MLSPLAYHIRQQIEKYGLRQAKFLLMVSGGQDSMVLCHAFSQLLQWQKNMEIRIVSVHHGLGENQAYRDRCIDLVKLQAEHYGFAFCTNQDLPKNLKSEEDFRCFRRSLIEKVRLPGEVLVSAHHFEDQMETRMIHLIRGCGPSGLVAMKVYDGDVFRPLLEMAKSDIEKYQQEFSVTHLEDPSNTKTQFLRNWLRQEWLPALEKYRPGALNCLANSLSNVAQVCLESEPYLKEWFCDNRLKRTFSIDLSQTHALQVLSLFLRSNAVHKYRRSQLEEVLKRLDKRQKSYRFELLGKLWLVNEDEVLLEGK